MGHPIVVDGQRGALGGLGAGQVGQGSPGAMVSSGIGTNDGAGPADGIVVAVPGPGLGAPGLVGAGWLPPGGGPSGDDVGVVVGGAVTGEEPGKTSKNTTCGGATSAADPSVASASTTRAYVPLGRLVEMEKVEPAVVSNGWVSMVWAPDSGTIAAASVTCSAPSTTTR